MTDNIVYWFGASGWILNSSEKDMKILKVQGKKITMFTCTL
jgi:hypothetical protein